VSPPSGRVSPGLGGRLATLSPSLASRAPVALSPSLRLGASAPFGHETTGRNEGVEPPCSLGASSASAARASTSASTSAAASVKPPRPACGEAPRGRGPVRTHVTNPAESALTRVRRRPAPTSPRVAPDRSLGGLDSRFFAAMRRFKSAAAPPGLAAHAGARYRVKAAPAVAQGLPRALPVNGCDFFRRRRRSMAALSFRAARDRAWISVAPALARCVVAVSAPRRVSIGAGSLRKLLSRLLFTAMSAVLYRTRVHIH
jgi:hypothetical protein